MRLVVNLKSAKAMVMTLPSGDRRPCERANRTELAMSAIGKPDISLNPMPSK
jgi:hypothetical protein